MTRDYAHQVEDCFDFAALTVLHCVKALLEHTDNPNLQVFRIFEEFISELTEAQVNSFKEFQGMISFLVSLRSIHLLT